MVSFVITTCSLKLLNVQCCIWMETCISKSHLQLLMTVSFPWIASCKLIASYAWHAQGINIPVDFSDCIRVTEALLPSLAVGKSYHYLHKNCYNLKWSI